MLHSWPPLTNSPIAIVAFLECKCITYLLLTIHKPNSLVLETSTIFSYHFKFIAQQTMLFHIFILSLRLLSLFRTLLHSSVPTPFGCQLSLERWARSRLARCFYVSKTSYQTKFNYLFSLSILVVFQKYKNQVSVYSYL